MSNIYNKILNEALDIMDFDSWDDEEQTFKDNIKNNLKNNIFVYKTPHKFKNYVQIFEKDPIKWSDSWQGWINGFKDTEVYINGISYPLTKDRTIDVSKIDNNIFEVVLKFPRQLKGKDCVNMFANSDIMKVPSLDVSECTLLDWMFIECAALVTVKPFEGLDNITSAWRMLGDIHNDQVLPNLDEETLNFWQPIKLSEYGKGTPRKWYGKGEYEDLT